MEKHIPYDQTAGIWFMWEDCIQPVSMISLEMGFGCTFARSMGLGKDIAGRKFSIHYYAVSGSRFEHHPYCDDKYWIQEFAKW